MQTKVTGKGITVGDMNLPSPGEEYILTRDGADRLRELRIQLGLPQQVVAERSSGVFSKSWLSNFERGGLGSPSFVKIMMLAIIYKLTLEEVAAMFVGEDYVKKYVIG